MIEVRRREASKFSARDEKREKGQFFTPEPVAKFMSSFFDVSKIDRIRVLDAGAGIGNLTHAFANSILRKKKKPAEVKVDVYELDEKCVPSLSLTLSDLLQQFTSTDVQFSSQIFNEDFITESVMSFVRNGKHSESYDVCVLNPPYRKLNSTSNHAVLLRKIGIRANNLYAAFVMLAVEQLKPGGQIAAILPRSFCNGPLFADFRRFISKKMCLKNIHVIESRGVAFEDENVLQETVILFATKSPSQRGITISSSSGLDFRDSRKRRVSSKSVILPADIDNIIHIPISEGQQRAWQRISQYTQTLDDLGLVVKTGPVVDFRSTEYFSTSNAENAVPLIYPHHFTDEGVEWPKEYKAKPNAIVDNLETRKWTVPKGYYIVIKRFSAKEDKQRLVARVVGPRNLAACRYAFENHINFISAGGEGVEAELAFGLAAFLNSTLANEFFEVFSGHTQVNVSDLKRFRFPEESQLRQLGKESLHFATQHPINAY